MNAIALNATAFTHFVLATILVVAAVIDWRTHRIPNWLTVGGALAGLAMSALPKGVGLLDSALGMLTALALLLPLYAARVTGAGDVKLVSMVGAFVGLPDVFLALVFIVSAGGLCALAFAAWHRRLAHLAGNTRDILQLAAIAALNGHRPALESVTPVGKLPYAVCVCAGTFTWLAWVHLRT